MPIAAIVSAGGVAAFFLTVLAMLIVVKTRTGTRPAGKQTEDGPEIAPRGSFHFLIGALFASIGVAVTAFAFAMQRDPSGNIDDFAYIIFAVGCIPFAMGLYKFLQGRRKSFRYNADGFRFRSTLGSWQTREWTDLKAVRLRRRSDPSVKSGRSARPKLTDAERAARAAKKWKNAYKFLDLRFEDGKKLWVYDDCSTFEGLVETIEANAGEVGYTFEEDDATRVRF